MIIHNWENVTVCRNCDSTRMYSDQHPSNPCPNCGDRVFERVGRWISDKNYWWQIWNNKGHWEVKE